MHPDRLEKPLHWRDPRCIFVNSVSDLFHEEVSDEFLPRVFGIMAATPQHIYIILTKRPERMLEVISDPVFTEAVLQNAMLDLKVTADILKFERDFQWPLKNVWLGTSIENQYWMKQRGDIMKEIDWPNKLVSFEPLLGPIDPTGYEKVFQWFIIGGESGPGARPMHPLWGSQLWHHLIPYAPGFWKQWGQWKPAGLALTKVEYDSFRRVHHNPKTTTNAIDDRYMTRKR